MGDNSLRLTILGNYSKTQLKETTNNQPAIHAPEFLTGFESVLFNREEITRIEHAQPDSKVILSAKYDV